MIRPRLFLLAVWPLAAAGCSPSPPLEGASASATPAAVATAADAAIDPADFSPLLGRWHRTDGDYTLEIRDVALDGRIDARYYNPGPIRVARAEAKLEEGRLLLLVELRDRNYPGNLYTLTFDPAGGVLRGLYSHLGLGQTFDVTFVRERAS